MNKKGFVLGGTGILLIIIGALFLFNVIGVTVLFKRISDSPYLIFIAIIGVIILLRTLKGK